jgi:hypothetical protein
METISSRFGQGGTDATRQDHGGLKSIVTELQGLRVKRVIGSAAGSADIPGITIEDNDTLLAAFIVGSAAGATFTDFTGSCELKAGSSDNLVVLDDASAGDLLIFLFDNDNAS